MSNEPIFMHVFLEFHYTTSGKTSMWEISIWLKGNKCDLWSQNLYFVSAVFRWFFISVQELCTSSAVLRMCSFPPRFVSKGFYIPKKGIQSISVYSLEIVNPHGHQLMAFHFQPKLQWNPGSAAGSWVHRALTRKADMFEMDIQVIPSQKEYKEDLLLNIKLREVRNYELKLCM